MIIVIGVLGISFNAKSQTCCLKLTLDVKKMPWVQCNLGGASVADSVFLYSGICTDGILGVDCEDYEAMLGEVWQYIVGEFDDPQPYTAMTNEGNGIFTKIIHINNYYGNPSYISTTEGLGVPMTQFETPLSMGIVFGNQNGDLGPLSGRDQTCNDIFIDELDTPNPRPIHSCPAPCTQKLDFMPLTAEWVTSTGLKPVKVLTKSKAFPNPFSDNVTIDVSFSEDQDNVVVDIFSVGGEKVKNIHQGRAEQGNNSFTWNADNDKGDKLSPGFYYYSVTSEQTAITGRLVHVN